MGADLTGTLRIASITLGDRFRDDYVHNARFGAWYEPVPRAMRDRLAAETQALNGALEAARQAVRADLSGERARDLLLGIGARTTALRQWIDGEKAADACRRVLRDVDTVEDHLGAATLAALGLLPPRLEAPARVAAGDAVPVRAVVSPREDIPVRTRLRVEGEAADPRLEARPGGWSTLRIRDSAQAGDRVKLVGKVFLGPEGRSVPVRTTRELTVVQPLEVSLASLGTSAETGAMTLAVTVRNNLARAGKARISVGVPPGWQIPAPQETSLQPGEEKTLRIVAAPGGAQRAGRTELSTEVVMGEHTARAAATALCIPPAANLVKNPGFEKGLTGWGGLGQFQHRHFGSLLRHCLAEIAQRGSCTGRSQVSQSVTLNQKRPAPVLVRVASRAENVAGEPGRGYALYVDIYYTDGTPLYGQYKAFPAGAYDAMAGGRTGDPA